MALLSKQQILEADDLPTEDVPVPAWGGTVRVRGLMGAERDVYEASMLSLRGKKRGDEISYEDMNLRNARARLVATCVVDEDGKRLFTSGDVEALGKKSGAALDRVYDVARRLSGLTDEDVEELEKNSSSDPSVASTSD